MPFADVVRSEDELRTIYRAPGEPAVRKQLDHLDAHCRSFLAHATFAVLATADRAGRCDASPKGGPAGFVRVLDDHRVAVADLSGNNRLDSITNLLDSAGVALWCCVPGIEETLRLNGHGCVTRDPDVLEACSIDGRTPRVAIGIDVTEAYIHCGKAVRRAELWQRDRWPDTSDMPTIGTMLRDHVGLEATGDEVSAVLEDGYRRTLWDVGGKRRETA